MGEVFVVLRTSEVQYRSPALSDLLAYGAPDGDARGQLVEPLTRRGRSSAVILIDLKDRSGTLTFHGKFEWFISRVPPAPA